MKIKTHFNLEIRCEFIVERGNNSWWGHCCLESPERDKLPPWAPALEVGTANRKGRRRKVPEQSHPICLVL